MALPGLLIEYLINGSIALLWILQLVKPVELSKIDMGETLFLIPIAYVLGMFVDVLAWLLTRPLKNEIRRRAAQTVLESTDGQYTLSQLKLFWKEKVEIEKSYPDLNSELSSRSSRDRIARGTFLNLLPISYFYWEQLSFWGPLLTIGALLMWIRFEHYNRCFEIRAALSIREEVPCKEATS